MKVLRKFAGALVILVTTTGAFAQGCSMCKTSAEAADAEQQKALNHGILMLAIPSVLIFGGLSIFAVRYRSKDTAADAQRCEAEGTDLL